MKVEYLAHMGNDLTVINAARISFNKFVTFPDDFTEKWLESSFNSTNALIPNLSDKDVRLMKYLAKHEHWTPFAHPHIQFYFKAPLFVARQLEKHQVGFVWSEVSRRYVTDEPEFYWPDKWRKKAVNKKQGSSDEEIVIGPRLRYSMDGFERNTIYNYNDLIDLEVCPEQARMILPQNMYTEWHWTGSLYGWARVCRQRLAPEAQKETADLLLTVEEICAKLFPYSWNALMGER